MRTSLRFGAVSLVFLAGALAAAPASAGDITVTFEDLSLAPNSYWNGPDPTGSIVSGPFGTQVQVGSFSSDGTTFNNNFNLTWGSWNGFAYSNKTDSTTPGFGNQFSAYAGSGFNSANYGVASGYRDIEPNLANPLPFHPTNKADLLTLPHLTLPSLSVVQGMYVTNTTYGALSMLHGDTFAKKFGGASGDDEDWLKLTAYGTDAAGNVLSTAVAFYLADFRFADNALDYIVQDWTYMDLSALAGATSLYFNVWSSDVGDYGMNTPGTWAVDNIKFAAVPEPSSLALGGVAVVVGAALALRRRPIRE